MRQILFQTVLSYKVEKLNEKKRKKNTENRISALRVAAQKLGWQFTARFSKTKEQGPAQIGSFQGWKFEIKEECRYFRAYVFEIDLNVYVRLHVEVVT